MIVNTITDLKTVALQSEVGTSVAVLMSLDIRDEDLAEKFVGEAAEKFKLQRMCSPPETNTLMITIIGDFAAARFAARWRQIAANDAVLGFFMTQMQRAEVVRGTAAGVALETVSLVEGPPSIVPPKPAAATLIMSGIGGIKSYDSETAYQRWRGGLGPHLAAARTLYARRKKFGFSIPFLGSRRVVWAVFVRAFWPIYMAGKRGHHGSVVFSFDPFFDDSPGLAEIAEDLRRLRETSGEPKHLAKFAEILRDDYKAPDRILIPAELACGRVAFFQSIYIPRKRLPGRYLHHRLVPITARPEGSSAQILPLEFWPEALQQTWRLGEPLLSAESLAEYQRRMPGVRP